MTFKFFSIYLFECFVYMYVCAQHTLLAQRALNTGIEDGLELELKLVVMQDMGTGK